MLEKSTSAFTAKAHAHFQCRRTFNSHNLRHRSFEWTNLDIQTTIEISTSVFTLVPETRFKGVHKKRGNVARFSASFRRIFFVCAYLRDASRNWFLRNFRLGASLIIFENDKGIRVGTQSTSQHPLEPISALALLKRTLKSYGHIILLIINVK